MCPERLRTPERRTDDVVHKVPQFITSPIVGASNPDNVLQYEKSRLLSDNNMTASKALKSMTPLKSNKNDANYL